MKSYSDYLTEYQNNTLNTSTANQTQGMRWVNDSIRALVGVFFFNESTFTATTGAQTQAYQLPFDVKQVINVTISIGSILWQPRESPSRKHFDALNVITFYNDFPQWYYIYNGQMLIWPIPASAGNTITTHYKRRLRDLSQVDYTTGTVTMTNGSPTVTGSGTTWTKDMVNRWLNIPATNSDTTSGDDGWYQIKSWTSTTSLTLYNNYNGNTISGGSNYTIGEVPILPEDYQDIPLYRASWIYYTSVNHNPEKAKFYKDLYDDGYRRMDAEFGAKTAGVGIDPLDYPVVNPNLFQQNISQA